MRIIAGALKGRRLTTPKGDTTRPTADQVRIALMDTLTPRLPGARVLDLFAGAGGVGLEALSRGAAEATLVERDPRAVAALRDNVAALGVTDTARVRRADVLRELAALYRAGDRFDIVFLDPPYDSPLYEELLEAIARMGLLQPDGLAVAEHFHKRALPEKIGGLARTRIVKVGDHRLSFYAHESSS